MDEEKKDERKEAFIARKQKAKDSTFMTIKRPLSKQLNHLGEAKKNLALTYINGKVSRLSKLYYKLGCVSKLYYEHFIYASSEPVKQDRFPLLSPVHARRSKLLSGARCSHKRTSSKIKAASAVYENWRGACEPWEGYRMES